MDFDEYDYLEKAVEEHDDRDSKKTKKEGSEKEERNYRRKDVDEKAAAGGLEDEERRSKRSRVEHENGRERSSRGKDRHRRDRDSERDKERDRERDRSSKERERDRDGEREKEIGKDGNRREKERGREHDKDKERVRKDRDIEKDRREKGRDREIEREERENERSRRSRSRSDLDKERDRERERELEMRDNSGRRAREKKEAEPEADPERDQRTVFAYQMPLKATERDVYEFFSKAGKVRDVRLIMDRNSRRSKGVGYIEFYDAMSVPMAIALSGNLMRGHVVMVKPSEAEKNLVQSNTTGGSTVTGPYGATDRKLYVGNLHFNMTETHLREIFEPFGPVELVQLPLDLETGQCKGFGFVQFAQLEHAKAAQSLNGKLELAGRTIKVSSVTDHVGAQDVGAKSADFDDDDGGGLSLNAQSRALLMQKLDRTGIATSIVGSIGVPVLNGAANLPRSGQSLASTPTLPANLISTPAVEPVGIPSECLLLKNMFDPASEMDPDFDVDIKDDVEEECSKYGRVKDIYVDKNSAGCVYLRFEDKNGSSAAQKAMHMRWFAGKMISAVFLQPQVYEAKFGAVAVDHKVG